MSAKTNKPRGLSLPRPEREPVYLMEAANGMLVRVPESKLESWQAAQRSAGMRPLTEAEKQLRDRILQDLYG